MPTQKQLISVLEQALTPFKGFETGNPPWVNEARRLLGQKQVNLSEPSVEAAKLLFDQAHLEASDAARVWLRDALQRGPKFAVYQADVLTGQRRGPAVGELLDLCGNAHVQFRKCNSKWYNAFKKAGLVRPTGNGVIELRWDFHDRQEHGLQLTAAKAAVEVFRRHGVDVKIWDYID